MFTLEHIVIVTKMSIFLAVSQDSQHDKLGTVIFAHFDKNGRMISAYRGADVPLETIPTSLDENGAFPGGIQIRYVLLSIDRPSLLLMRPYQSST